MESRRGGDAFEPLLGQFAEDLRSTIKWINVSDADLGRYGVLNEGESFRRFVGRELAIGRSLQPEAIEHTFSRLPPTTDTSAMAQARAFALLDEEKENKIRLRALTNEHSGPQVSHKVMRQFTREVYTAIGVYNKGEDATADPSELTGHDSIDVLGALLDTPPQITHIDGQLKWMIPKPGEGGSNFARFVGDIFVVPDYESNSRLTAYVLTHPELLRYFFDESLRQVQKTKIGSAIEKLGGAASRKYDEITDQVRRTNAPLQRHLFNLLLRDTQASPIHLHAIFRDYLDLETFKSGVVSTDRTGSESGVQSFRVSLKHADVLRFEYEDQEVYWEMSGARREMRTRKVAHTVYAKVNESNGRIQLGTMENGVVGFTDEGQLKTPISSVRSFFDKITVLSVDQMKILDDDTYRRMVIDSEKLVESLLDTAGSIELFAQLRGHGVAEYPKWEYLAEPDLGSLIPVDAFFTSAPTRDIYN